MLVKMALLMQGDKIVEYAGRALIETKKNYSQIKKELLGILFAMERWQFYVHDKRVVSETDHKPLLSIFKNSLASSPKRVQRVFLRLQKYDIDLRFKSGKQLIIADTLSRPFDLRAVGIEFTEEIALLQTTDAEQMASLRMIVFAPRMQLITAEILRPFATFIDELSVCRDTVFKGVRLVVPMPARQYNLNGLHQARFGLNGCQRKRLLAETGSSTATDGREMPRL